MPSTVASQASTGRWHAIGLVALLWLLGLYALKAYFVGGGRDSRVYWFLGGVAALAVVVAAAGRVAGWQRRPGLLIAWPLASLSVTTVTGALAVDVTRELPGAITITFAYLGLTCPRGHSLVAVPLGVAAFVVGGGKSLPHDLSTVVLAAIMWVLVAEVPAWLVARLEEQSRLLRNIAQTDSLTQLLNRSTLGTQLSAHASRSAVVLIDLDNFKRYNDTHGHTAGDDLLVAFAGALRWSVREGGTVFRIGGDEFLILLVDADRGAAERVLARLRHSWAQAGEPVGFSAGIAADEHDLMRLADEHMYADKRARGVSAD